MNKLFFTLSRLIVGLIFVFSGFVKAVDPVGFSIKFTEYLTSFHLESLSFFVMPLAFIISALEFLTGIHLLLGIRIKMFSFVALIFMAIFTPLTLWSAIFNPVTDCGCFGDAVKLTNWETFFKNIVLLIPALYLFLKRKNYTCKISIIRQSFISIVFTIIILGVAQFSVKHLPLLDFRPYKIGKNITEGMIIPEGAQQPEYETTFIMEKDGVQKEFGSQNYPYNDSTWVFINSNTKVINEGYKPPIHDFVLANESGDDITQKILSEKKPTLLIISPQIKKGKWGENLGKLSELQKSLAEKGIKTYFVTASTNDDITDFEFGSQGGFDYLTADETMLKTVIRSNPGIILIQDGNIMGKWHYNDIPEIKEFNTPVSYAITELINKKENLTILLLVCAAVLFSSLIMIKGTK